MVPRRMAVPRLVLPKGNVPELRPDGDDVLTGPVPDNLRRVSDDGTTVVPDRTPEPETDHLRGTHEGVLHIALVVPTSKLKRVLDQHIFAIYPPDWPGTLKIHVLVKDPRDSEESMLWRYLVREAGLATSKQAGFLYPEEIEMGWKEDEPS